MSRAKIILASLISECPLEELSEDLRLGYKIALELALPCCSAFDAVVSVLFIEHQLVVKHTAVLQGDRPESTKHFQRERSLKRMGRGLTGLPAILVKLRLAGGLGAFCGPSGAGQRVVASRAGLGLEGNNVKQQQQQQQQLLDAFAVALFDPATPALNVRACVVAVRMPRGSSAARAGTA